MRCMVTYLVGLQFSELSAEINKPCSHNVKLYVNLLTNVKLYVNLLT